jgi:hypothetical protein
MNDNPNTSIHGISGLPQFYTGDITLMPVAVIWRMVARQSILRRCLLFSYFLGRKALKLRHVACQGSCRPTHIPSIPDEQVPDEVNEAFIPFVEVCSANHMKRVRCIRSPCIGNKTSFTSIWLDPTGKVYCSITWIDLRLGALRKTKTLLACHTWLDSGVELSTAQVTPEEWIPELIPPRHDIMPLAADTQPSDVIDCHYERIANRSDIVRMDEDLLLKRILRGSQEVFDHMVSKGVYSPLTDAETQQLLSVTAEIHGSGDFRKY